jgi:hypothetical protein
MGHNGDFELISQNIRGRLAYSCYTAVFWKTHGCFPGNTLENTQLFPGKHTAVPKKRTAVFQIDTVFLFSTQSFMNAISVPYHHRC